MKLTIELVPKSAWFNNLRSLISQEQWDALRKQTYRRVQYRCEICGGRGKKHPVECHEKWSYDDEQHVATLTGLYGLCPSCHEVKHIGLAHKNGRLDIALQHLACVNQITVQEARNMANAAMQQWQQRSQFNWQIDIQDFLKHEKDWDATE